MSSLQLSEPCDGDIIDRKRCALGWRVQRRHQTEHLEDHHQCPFWTTPPHSLIYTKIACRHCREIEGLIRNRSLLSCLVLKCWTERISSRARNSVQKIVFGGHFINKHQFCCKSRTCAQNAILAETHQTKIFNSLMFARGLVRAVANYWFNFGSIFSTRTNREKDK